MNKNTCISILRLVIAFLITFNLINCTYAQEKLDRSYWITATGTVPNGISIISLDTNNNIYAATKSAIYKSSLNNGSYYWQRLGIPFPDGETIIAMVMHNNNIYVRTTSNIYNLNDNAGMSGQWQKIIVNPPSENLSTNNMLIVTCILRMQVVIHTKSPAKCEAVCFGVYPLSSHSHGRLSPSSCF